MMQVHEFNSRWWGGRVGIVTDSAWFLRDAEALQAELLTCDWAEYTAAETSTATRLAAHRAGFFHADTHIQFRIDLRRFAAEALPPGVEVRQAGVGVDHWKPSGLRPFEHERFAMLTGCTPERLVDRYAVWAAELALSTPATCLEIFLHGRCAGWFLSRPSKTGLELALAMTAADEVLPGATLYRVALGAYARSGFRIGHAGFGVRNRSVHNIYAALGARFTGTRDAWLWQPAPPERPPHTES